MPNRIIRDQARTSLSLAALSNAAERTFWRLIVTVDDFGRYHGSTNALWAALYPEGGWGMSARILETALVELEAQQMIRRYEIDGRSYVCVDSWTKHQRCRAKDSKFPPPPQVLCSQGRGQLTADDRNSRSNAAGNGIGNGIGDVEDQDPPPTPPRGAAEPPGFSDWYKAYPRKVGRPTAAKAYRKALQQGATAEALLAAVEAQKRWPPGHGLNKSMTDGGDPHPSTWLNQGRWEDEKPVIKSPYEVM